MNTNIVLCIHCLNASKNLSLTFTQRVAFEIMLLFERNQGCYVRFETNEKVEHYHLTLSVCMEDQSNKEEREERGHKQIRDQTFSLSNTILYMYFFHIYVS